MVYPTIWNVSFPIWRTVHAESWTILETPVPSLPYLLTPWCRVLLEKLTGLQLVKKFPTFYGTRRFITALTRVRHLSLSWANPIQSTYPHPTSWRSILILSTLLCLGLSSGLFPSGFPTKTLYAFLSSSIRATCPAHLILLDFITRTISVEEYRSLSSSLCSLLHSPVTSSLLGPNILLNTIFQTHIRHENNHCKKSSECVKRKKARQCVFGLGSYMCVENELQICY